MLKIRLQRVGRKNDASFRVVVIESQRGPKAGNALEVLGFYDPKKNVIEIKGDRVTHWISVGAQVSDTVHNLLVKKKIIKGDKINVLPKKSPIKKESENKNDGGENKPADAESSCEAKEESNDVVKDVAPDKTKEAKEVKTETPAEEKTKTENKKEENATEKTEEKSEEAQKAEPKTEEKKS